MERLLLGVVVPFGMAFELFLVALVHSCLWSFNAGRDPNSMCFNRLPSGPKFAKTPYFRTFTAFFFFSCMRLVVISI
jgi:hypothetical protein